MAKHRTMYFDSPATDEQIARVAPSVFSTEPHASRSAKFAQVTTADILRGLRGEGWEVFSAGQTLAVESRRLTTKHMLRLRHQGAHALSLNDSESAPELLLMNANDGTSSWQMFGGMIRFACLNGLIHMDDGAMNVRIRHTGDAQRKAIEGAALVLDGLTRVVEDRDQMRSITLTGQEQVIFAGAALELQYDPGQAPITARQLLVSRRYEDNRDDLWTTFNRVQENLVRGGIRGVNAAGRRSTTRGIVALDKDVKLNRALWALADKMAELKTGVSERLAA
jgi:hypothetical protein